MAKASDLAKTVFCGYENWNPLIVAQINNCSNIPSGCYNRIISGCCTFNKYAAYCPCPQFGDLLVQYCGITVDDTKAGSTGVQANPSGGIYVSGATRDSMNQQCPYHGIGCVDCNNASC